MLKVVKSALKITKVVKSVLRWWKWWNQHTKCGEIITQNAESGEISTQNNQVVKTALRWWRWWNQHSKCWNWWNHRPWPYVKPLQMWLVRCLILSHKSALWFETIHEFLSLFVWTWEVFKVIMLFREITNLARVVKLLHQHTKWWKWGNYHPKCWKWWNQHSK